ncbi:hypothetical protein IWX49DRAFT_351277 [Phyllosticta citricarpa]|uniref:Secreted protein n=1 Tax=Phyllosticta paracitricarpa TaxID=2016321 RepID=A0ABR1MSA6_9PEZI
MLRTAIRLLYAISLGAESAPKKANFAHFAYFARFILPGGLHPPLWSSVSSLNSACVLLSSLFACQLGLVLFCIRARCSKETRDATGSEFRLQGRRWPVPGLPLGFILRRRPPASTSSLSRLLFQSRVLQRHCKRHRFINSSMVCRPNEGFSTSIFHYSPPPCLSAATRRQSFTIEYDIHVHEHFSHPDRSKRAALLVCCGRHAARRWKMHEGPMQTSVSRLSRLSRRATAVQ